MGIWEEIQELVDDDKKYKNFVRETENKMKNQQKNSRIDRQETIRLASNRLNRFNEIANNVNKANYEANIQQQKQKENYLNALPKISQNVLPTAKELSSNKKYNVTGIAKDTEDIKPMSARKIAEMTNYNIDRRNLGNFVKDNILPTASDIGKIVANVGLGAYTGVLNMGEQVARRMNNTVQEEQSAFNNVHKMFGKPELNKQDYSPYQKSIDAYDNLLLQANNTIQKNIESTNNPIMQKLAEIAVPAGNMLPGMLPGGAAYFTGSAANQYYKDGLSRGMEEDKADLYGGIMGLVEGGTEVVGALLTKGIGKSLAKGELRKSLKLYGLDIAENFAEEAIIEPISESVSYMIGGANSSDFDNMGQRMLQSGIDGALLSIIMGGVSAGIGGAKNIYDKFQKREVVSRQEFTTVLEDIQKSGMVDVETIIKKEVQNVIKNESVVDKHDIMQAKNTNELPTAQSELINGINNRTQNNLLLANEELPRARAKIENNKITLDTKTGTLADIIHEASHYSENNSKGYETLKAHVLSELERTGELDGIKQDIMSRYEKVYNEENRFFTDQDLESEVVAKYTERFINDELFVDRITKTDRNFAQKIYDWIKEKVNYYKAISKLEPEQKMEYDNLRKAEKLWENALKGVQENHDTNKYSIAGKKGMNNAIKQDPSNIILERNYNKALQMAKNNIDNETIRKTTDWFQDKNGDWKFEFTDKYMSLNNNTKLKNDTSYKLVDVLQHNTLFMAYPELKNYNVKMSDMNANGAYINKTKTIKINNNLLNNRKSIEGTLIHEIQHAIQHIEDFETGKSPKKSRLAYYNSLGEIEAADTKNRFYAEKYNRQNISNVIPESSKATPQHQKLGNYLQKRGTIDKIKDSIYNYFNTKGSNYEQTDKENQEHLYETIRKNSNMVDGRRRIDNTAPTAKNNNAPRYSLNQELDNSSSFSVDDKGRILSKKQQEYFKDSKVKDDKGNLLTVYHGTPNDFTQFSYDFIGSNGTALGKGFYLTDDINIADSYGKDGKVMELYVDIKKPLSLNSISISKNEYKSFIKAVDKRTEGQFLSDYGEVEFEGYNNVLNRAIDSYDYNENDVDLVHEVFNTAGLSWEEGFRILKDTLGYDGVIEENFNGTDSKVYVPVLPEQIKNVDNTNPSSKPDIRYSLSDTKGPVRKFYENVETSKVISDEVKNSLEPKSYRKLTNDESMATAIAKLNSDIEEETKWRRRNIDKTNSVDVAEGLALLAKYQSEGKYEAMLGVIDKLAEIGTKAGQQVQMFALLQRLTPEGMVNYAQKSLDRALEETARYKNQKWIDEHKQEFTLNTEDTKFITEHMEKVMKLEDGREKQILLAEIQKRLSDKLPPDRGASIKAYMRLSMLFNTKTQIRNILGNTLIAPVNATADTFATIADRAIAKKTGIRTKGLTNVKSVADGMITGAYKSFDDFKRNIDTRNLASDRFEIGNGIRGANFSNKNRFGRAMNSLDRTLSFMLDMGDRPFYESAFLNSINNQMNLNNVPKPTAEMVEIATTEALQRTWQDDNVYTAVVLTIRNAMNGKIKYKNIDTKGMRYGLGDLLIPFAKTPANLTKAIVDYSPAGLVKTLISDAKQLNNAISKKENVSKYQHKFVDNLGKGIAGSFLYIVGYALAKAGIATGENDDDKDVANFMKNTLGVQPYSIRIGDKSFTYDWAQPVAVPLEIMANFEKYSKDNPGANAISKAIKASIIGSEQLFEQSFMASINNVINGYNESKFENLFDEILALPARAVPTFLKQIADMVDGTQRTSFDKTDKLATAKNKVISKLPVVSKTLAPTVDTFGREIEKYGGDNNFFNVFFNPANTNKGKLTESAKEVYDLYKKTGDKTIFPIQAAYSINLGEEKIEMDPYMRANYQKSAGQYSDAAIKELINSSDYKKLSNNDKAKIIKDVVTDSNLNAKKEVLSYKTDDETQKERAEKRGLTLSNMYIYNDIIKKMESEKDSKGDTIKGSKQSAMARYIAAMKTSDTQKDKLLAETSTSDTKVTMKDLKTVGLENYTQFLSVDAESRGKYKLLVSTGINSNELNKYWNEISKIKGQKDENGKTISGSKKQAVQEYINNLNLSTEEKLLLYASTGNYSLSYSEKIELHNYIKSIKGMTTTEKNKLISMLECFK